jgi:glucose-fructose oxidoreductase
MGKTDAKIRYAVVGLGHIAQAAVVPAFEHASENSELVAFVSDDSEKLEKLSKKYGVENCFSYADYQRALKMGIFDAVYIALPNDMHKDFSVAASRAGIHVLCEKPMAMSVSECEAMIAAAEENNTKLMIAYRLHFEKTNMKAVEVVHSGKIGEPRIFNSSFTMQVKEGNIRTEKEHGGGPLFDIGIYCINAARYIFKDEPLEVMAIAAKSNEARFAEIEEAAGVVLKFPKERLANFMCSFGAADISRYEVVGTEGRVTVDPAYEYVDELKYMLVRGDHEETHKTPKRDQFAPELIHFSDCILNNTDPRPSGYEGLADIRVIEAIKQSLHTRRSVAIAAAPPKTSKPDADLIQERPPVKKPELVKVESSSK